MHAEVAKIYGKKKSSICEIVKKEKEIHAYFAVAPQIAKVTATVHDKCLVRMKKAWKWYIRYFKREKAHTHMNFITDYFYKCSILLLAILNLLLWPNI